jgi:hypothetical protein
MFFMGWAVSSVLVWLLWGLVSTGSDVLPPIDFMLAMEFTLLAWALVALPIFIGLALSYYMLAEPKVSNVALTRAVREDEDAR